MVKGTRQYARLYSYGNFDKSFFRFRFADNGGQCCSGGQGQYRTGPDSERSCSSVALSRTSVGLDHAKRYTVPSKSPITLCAHISTPPVILKLPRTPSLPSIAVLSGADHSFPSRSPFAAITVKPRRLKHACLSPCGSWLSWCSGISAALSFQLRPGMPCHSYSVGRMM